MSLIKEFREFASRGSVVDLAVGIVIGGAFGKIVSSLVSDVLMPPIGLVIGGVNFKDLNIKLKEEAIDAAGKSIPAVTLNYGNFIQTIFDFIIIAFAIFMIVKAMNKMNRLKLKKQEEDANAVPLPAPEPAPQEKLLMEIRDILKTK